MIQETEQELVVIESLDVPKIFEPNGLDVIIDEIEAKANEFVSDISTEAGRKEVASFAFKIARSKKLVEKLGKDCASEAERTVKNVRAERMRGVARLQEIQDRIRQPLDEYEQKEKDRIEAHEKAIEEIKGLAQFEEFDPSMQAIQDRIASLFNYRNREWQEFKGRGEKTYNDSVLKLSEMEKSRRKYEEDQKELARLKKLEEEQKQKEHDEAIAKKAAKAAKLAAEEKARKEKEIIEKKAQQETDAAKQREFELKQEKKAAEKLAKEKERLRIAAEKKAKADAEAALRQAEIDKEEALEAERQRLQAEQERIEKEKQVEEDKEAKRQANKKHRKKIEDEIWNSLFDNLGEGNTDYVLTKLIANEIPHVQINY